ncbi:unnamed protein product, partial [Adineta ricciae]
MGCTGKKQRVLPQFAHFFTFHQGSLSTQLFYGTYPTRYNIHENIFDDLVTVIIA